MPMLIEFIEKYGLFAVFFNVLAESLGLPLPSYPVLLIAAASIASHHYNAADIVLVGVIASLIGDTVLFWSGRRFGPAIVGFLCRISLSPDSCVRQTSAITRRIGPIALSFTKFLPGLGTMAIVLTGVTRASLRSFLFFDVVGSALYMTVAVTLGTIFHHAVEDIMAVGARWGNWGLAVIILLIGSYLLNKWWQRRQVFNMDRITIGELQALIDGESKPVVIDAQTAEGRSIYGIIPNAITIDVYDPKSIPTDFPATGEIVIYCSCPNEASAVFIAKKLRKAGYKRIRPLLGGIEAWREAERRVASEGTSAAA